MNAIFMSLPLGASRVYQVLAALIPLGESRRLSHREIAALGKVSAATVSGAMPTLEEFGLVSRSAPSLDGYEITMLHPPEGPTLEEQLASLRGEDERSASDRGSVADQGSASDQAEKYSAFQCGTEEDRSATDQRSHTDRSPLDLDLDQEEEEVAPARENFSTKATEQHAQGTLLTQALIDLGAYEGVARKVILAHGAGGEWLELLKWELAQAPAWGKGPEYVWHFWQSGRTCGWKERENDHRGNNAAARHYEPVVASARAPRRQRVDPGKAPASPERSGRYAAAIADARRRLAGTGG